MKRLLLITIALVFGFLLASAAWYYSKIKTDKSAIFSSSSLKDNKVLLNRLHLRSGKLLLYARQHGFNTNTCFLIDMSLPSGRNRFFVYDLQKDSMLAAGLVAHGCCNKQWLNGRQYGNTVGCGCTSLGKYKV